MYLITKLYTSIQNIQPYIKYTPQKQENLPKINLKMYVITKLNRRIQNIQPYIK
jgi:hypothetical protein